MEIVQPAQLSQLAIYNPSLGGSDETLHNQVLYYYSAQSNTTDRLAGKSEEDIERIERENQNECLRQIGLAQGMVEFAKAFSDGEPVNSVDSEKSRTVLHELEPGWWLLAIVDLARIRNTPSHSRSKSEQNAEPTEEFSSREVAPQELLLEQLLRAHRIFLLHHAPSLLDLYVRLSREKFCNVLEDYWSRFIQIWDVLLHGNPSVDIFNGINLAAGGELGVGVGEEEWGSGEREVLEGFIGRTDGLVDVVVSRFGEVENTATTAETSRPRSPWLGKAQALNSNDGVIFSGIGAVTRPSLRAVTSWMEDIYRYGAAAYGVADGPTRRRRRRKQVNKSTSGTPQKPTASNTQGRGRHKTSSAQPLSPTQGSPGIPPPIVRAADDAGGTMSRQAERAEEHGEEKLSGSPEPTTTDTFVKYMTLGVYGSSWGIPSGRPRSSSQQPSAAENSEPTSPAKPLRRLAPKSIDASDPNAGLDVDNGCFLIGLRGDLEAEDDDEDEDEQPDVLTDDAGPSKQTQTWNRRIMVRTLQIEVHATQSITDASTDTGPSPPPYFDRHRVVVYARRPFLFAFLFGANTPTLSYTALYKSLHHQLGPLQRPLLRSTSPQNAHARAHATLRSPRTTSEPGNSSGGSSGAPIYDLLYDPATLTVLTSLPAIPEPGTAAAEGIFFRSAAPESRQNDEWTRLDALSVHSHVLQTVAATRRYDADAERLLKTSRGWWIVWMRLPDENKAEKDAAEEASGVDGGESGGTASAGFGGGVGDSDDARRKAQASAQRREAILVRQASDHTPSAPAGARKGFAYGYGFGGGGGGGSGAASAAGSPARGKEGMGRIVEGIGVDARRYVEGLLSLRR